MTRMQMLVGLALSVALAPFAAARTQTASSGVSNHPGEDGCWTIHYQSKKNTCSSMRKLYVPAVIDNSGGRWVYVTASGATVQNTVGCIAYGWNKDLESGYHSGALEYLSSFPDAQDIALWLPGVPSQGAMFVHCEVMTNGSVHQIRFNP